MKIQMNKKVIDKIKEFLKMFNFKKNNQAEKDNKLVNTESNKRRKVSIEDLPKEEKVGNVNETLNKVDKKIKEYRRPGARGKKKKTKILDYLSNLFFNNKKISRAYYFILFLMIVLAGASVYITFKAYRMFSKQDYAVYSSSIDTNQPNENSVSIYDNSNEQKDTSSTSTQNKEAVSVESKNTTNTATKSSSSNTSTDTKSKTSSSTSKSNSTKSTIKVEPLSFSKPISGDILKPYSVDNVVYSKTLDLWTIHDALDIKGSLGQEVKAIERGTVEKVYDDSFYGKVIVIDHGQGYESLYGNLDNTVSVKEKQTVKKGQVIGKIGNTAIGEIKDEPHLHIQMFKDGKTIDPSTKF